MRKLTAVLLLLVASALCAEEKNYTRNVAIVLYPNVQPLDWTGPYEVYKDAANFGSANGKRAFNVYTVSKEKRVNGQGLQLEADYTIKDAPKPDIVVFPGGPASTEINDDPEFFAWAKNAATEAEIAQSVCTGAFVLGKAGLLDGLPVTTFYGAIEELRRSFPKADVQDGRRYVDNGHIVTTAGISAGIDGSLHVVARLLGRRVADQTARYMEYHWTPESYLARAYQYLNPSTDERGRLVQSASLRIEEKDFPGAIALYRQALERDRSDGSTWYVLGETLHGAKQYDEAAQAFLTAANGAEGFRLQQSLYNAACSFAQGGRLDEGLDSLRKAYAAGLRDRNAVSNDPDLAPLKNHPKLATVLAAAK
ncbi:MAG TPA: DJ-1/PfpI family protein [Thermoanaerobaculia bacterium]|nr:DJ-1/PfpI family protein [Thermoanaerobaculia bacterium]